MLSWFLGGELAVQDPGIPVLSFLSSYTDRIQLSRFTSVLE